ncbi:phosphoribosylglycinamide formyltransferase [Sulfurimonas sp.]
MKKIAILSSHNGSGLDAIYDAIEQKNLNAEIALVISNNTNAVVLQKAQKYALDSYLINAKTDASPDDEIIRILNEKKCKYIFLAGYMKKLSSKITRNFRVINSHPALLPKYGGSGMYGSHVHKAVIKNGETQSGVTIHKVSENYDEGEIILQIPITLSKDETAETLEIKIKKLERQAIVQALNICLK